MKTLVCHYHPSSGNVFFQRAEYIEDGPYIKYECENEVFIVWEIPQYGGEERLEGVFSTLPEALERYYWIIENHT
jgi:hypothetical protein